MATAFNFEISIRPQAPGGRLIGRRASNLELDWSNGFTLVDIARHHMIPWHVIRRSWNTIASRIKASIVLQAGLRRYVTAIEREAAGWNGFNRNQVANACDSLQKLVDGEYAHDKEAVKAPFLNDISRVLCWNPRNIFLGPDGSHKKDHRLYSKWITTVFPIAPPQWYNADPREQFENNARHIIERISTGHFSRLRIINNNLSLQMNKEIGPNIDRDLIEWLDMMVDTGIPAEILGIRNGDWVQVTGFREQRVWRWVRGSYEEITMPVLDAPSNAAYLVYDDPRIIFPVNDGGWQKLAKPEPLSARVPEIEATYRRTQPLQSYQPGDHITIGGKTIELEVGTDEDDASYMDASGVVNDVTLTDAASFLMGQGGGVLPPLFDGLRVDLLNVFFYQEAQDHYEWRLTAFVSVDLSGVKVEGIAEVCANSDTMSVDSNLTIRFPVGNKLIAISGTFGSLGGERSILLTADLVGSGVSVSDLVDSFLGSNPIPSELGDLSVSPKRILFLYADGPQKSASIALDFGRVQVFAGRFSGGNAAALRLSTGDVASFSSLPYVGGLLPPSADLIVTDVGVFWSSGNVANSTVALVAMAQVNLGWAPFYPQYPNGAIDRGLHAVARVATKSGDQSSTVQRHLQ